MKSISKFIFAVIALLGSLNAACAQEFSAQVPVPRTSASLKHIEKASISDAESVIKKMHSDWRKYIADPSVQGIENLLQHYSESMISNGSGELIVGKEDFRNDWMEGVAKIKSLPNNFSMSGSSKILKSKFVSPGFVLIYTSEKVDYYSNGKKLNPLDQVWTYLVAKQQNQWKIISQSGSTKTNNQ